MHPAQPEEVLTISPSSDEPTPAMLRESVAETANGEANDGQNNVVLVTEETLPISEARLETALGRAESNYAQLERTQSGSGSLEQDGPFSIVAMKKEEQTGLVHDLGRAPFCDFVLACLMVMQYTSFRRRKKLRPFV